METHCTHLERSGTLPSSVRTLIEDPLELEAFNSFPPTPEGYERAIEARKMSGEQREKLSQRLFDQYAESGVEGGQAVRSNIEALKDGKTFTVTTGHQLCIFSGPLLFIHKVLHTIRLAEALQERHPDKHFVPVHWMASEDHDLPEVDHVVMDGVEWKWPTDQQGAVGRMSTKGLEELLERSGEGLSRSPFGKEWVEILKRSYPEAKDLASATRHILDQLFGEKGLVVIDGDDPTLKNSFKEDMAEEFRQNRAERSVEKKSQELEESGHKRQVNPRPVNLFYLRENYRERIEQGDDDFFTVDQEHHWTEEEVLAELEAHPERFSPNVILRPLYQERILPNIAYVGGPAETAYWLQLKGLFDEADCYFPVLQPRDQVFHLDGKSIKLLEELGIGPEELLCGKEGLFKRLVKEQHQGELDLEKEKKAFEELYENLAKKAAAIDPNLWDPGMAEKRKAEKGLERLKKKMLRHMKKKEATLEGRIDRLYERLFPNGVPQERKENLGSFYAREGKELLERTRTALPPFHPHIVWLPEKGS